MMVENVIHIDARNTNAESVEGFSLEPIAVDAIAHAYLAQLIVAASTAVEQVDTYLRRVDTQIELTLAFVAKDCKILQVESRAKKYPAPAEVRAYLDALVGSEHDALTVAAEYEVLEVFPGLWFRIRLENGKEGWISSKLGILTELQFPFEEE